MSRTSNEGSARTDGRMLGGRALNALGGSKTGEEVGGCCGAADDEPGECDCVGALTAAGASVLDVVDDEERGGGGARRDSIGARSAGMMGEKGRDVGAGGWRGCSVVAAVEPC